MTPEPTPVPKDVSKQWDLVDFAALLSEGAEVGTWATSFQELLEGSKDPRTALAFRVGTPGPAASEALARSVNSHA